MDGIRQADKNAGFRTFASIVAVLAVLHIAREIFIPIAIAILLSFLLAPLVRHLIRWHFPNVIAVAATVLIAFSCLGTLGWVVSQQFVNLVDNLPKYQVNLENKVSSLLAGDDDSALNRAAETLDTLREGIEREVEEEQSETFVEQGSDAPVAVEIRQPPPGPFERLRDFAEPLLGPLGTAALTLVFVIFILLQRNDLRDRFVKLTSGGNLNLATEVVDDITGRISRYLLMHTLINVAYGFPVALGLYFIGVPSALLWGILATLLRFIPFIGPWIAALFPITLAFAVDPGWMMPIMTIGLIVTIELFSNNVLEPWLYGSSTGISMVALIFAAVVWTWIWGPVGLFLAIPITVCLVVLGKYYPPLRFLNTLFGNEPVLPLEAQFYQRMLSMDRDSMHDIAVPYLASHPLGSFYDEVVIPALVMAEWDRNTGTLAETRQEFIIESIHDLLEAQEEENHLLAASDAESCQVLCWPAREPAEALSALMLMHLLRASGISCAEVPAGLAGDEVLQRAEELGAAVICLCALPPRGLLVARKLSRRFARLDAPVPLMIGIWGSKEEAATLEHKLGKPAPYAVSKSLIETSAQISALLGLAPAPDHPHSAP